MPLLRHYKENDLLHIYLNDPSSQNAFSPAMAEELDQLVTHETYSAILVTNLGSSFCAGGNLRFYKNLSTKQEGLDVNLRIRGILQRLANLPVPKACFVNGACYGGGVELISCFDYVVASPQSLFGLWQRRIGLTFGWGGEERLARRLNSRTLYNWLLGAETISAFSAKKWGLVDDIQLSSSGLNKCVGWVHRCLSFGSASIAPILSNRDQQNQAFSSLWHSDVHKKVLKNFK